MKGGKQMAGKLIMVTGGARSGKSEFAEQYVLHYAPKCDYIATAEVLDQEMAERVRIPLTDERGNAMDARAFATLLRKYLAKSPYNITAKVMQRGLGEAILVLAEKQL